MSVVAPTALFAIFNMIPDKQPVYVHALLFVSVYWVLAKVMGLVLTKADLIVPTILFMALSPRGHVITNTVLVRTAMFAVIFILLRKLFPKYY